MAEENGWSYAVRGLTEARSTAETCASSFKQFADIEKIGQGRYVYGKAKAKFDGIIAELITTLSEGKTASSLPALQGDIALGAGSLQEFCHMTEKLMPNTEGRKDIKLKFDISSSLLERLLSYVDHSEADKLMRETIKEQLEAAQWHTFADIKAAQ